MTKLEFDYTAQEQLALSQESISEAINNGFTSLSQMYNSILGQLPSIISGFSKMPLTSDLGEVKLKRADRKFVEKMAKANYNETRLLVTYTPEGLKVSYLDYLTVLSGCVDEIKNIKTAVIDPYLTFLSVLVSHPGALRLSDSKQFEYAHLEQVRAEHYEKISDCFKTGSTETKSTVGKMVARNADWNDVIRLAHKLKDDLDSINRNNLDTAVKQCRSYLDTLQHKLEQNKDEGVSVEVAERLSAGAYQVASEVEFFAIVYFRTITLLAALDRSIEKLMEIVEA